MPSPLDVSRPIVFLLQCTISCCSDRYNFCVRQQCRQNRIKKNLIHHFVSFFTAQILKVQIRLLIFSVTQQHPVRITQMTNSIIGAKIIRLHLGCTPRRSMFLPLKVLAFLRLRVHLEICIKYQLTAMATGQDMFYFPE